MSFTEERPTDFRYVTLILRLLVSREDQLVQGEVGRVPDEHWVRFRGADDLLEAVRACITWRDADEGEVS